MGNSCYQMFQNFLSSNCVSKHKDQYAHKCPLCMGVKLGWHMKGRPQTQQNA
jgi:hypothetical protein